MKNKLNHLLISIIIATKNSAKYIEETLKSIYSQTYKHYEIIVVDCLSTDRTIEIVEKYSEKVVTIIREKDNGLSEAVNKGFKCMNGDICTFFGSDDIYYPDAFERAVKEFESNPNLGLIFCDVDTIDANGSFVHSYDASSTQLEYLLNINPTAPNVGAFYSSHFVRKVGFVNESYKQAMDYDLMIKLMKVSDYKYYGKPAAMFRAHGKNLTFTSGAYYSPIETFRTAWREGGKLFTKANIYRLTNMLRYFKYFVLNK